MIIQDNIKKLLIENDIKASELADTIGISRSTMSGYINGKYVPSAEITGNIAKFFNVSCDFLIFGEKQDINISKDKADLLALYDQLDKKSKMLAIEEIKHLLKIQKIKNM